LLYIDGKGDKKGMSKFLLEIISNIKVSIERLCIRIEDPTFPFALGFMFPDVGVKTCDENWNKVKLMKHPEYMFKSIFLKDFTLFLDRDR
jgi:hypothetical protein